MIKTFWNHVRFEVFTAVTMTPCRYCINRLPPPAHTGSSFADFSFFYSTLKMEAIRSSGTSAYTITTRRHMNFISDANQNLKIYHLFLVLLIPPHVSIS
jgi:hypothetical protein